MPSKKSQHDRESRLRRNKIVVLPGPGAPVDPVRMERNRLLTQRGYAHGTCWECEFKGEVQEEGMVKRRGVNGYVCPRHGGDDGDLEQIVVLLPAHRIGKGAHANATTPCSREGCGHPRHSHKGGTGYCQRGTRCACEGFVDPAATVNYRIPKSPAVQAIKLRDKRQREAQLLHPIEGLTEPPTAKEKAWLKQQGK